MNKTMKYYFIKKPKELIKIYDQVLAKLSEMESYLEKEASLIEQKAKNRWTGRESYCFPDTSVTDDYIFDITLDRTGFYTLTFSATLTPDNNAKEPGVTIWSCNADSIETGKREYFETLRYITDGQPHTYSLKLFVPRYKRIHLRGWFYDFEENPNEWKNRTIFEDISLVFSTSGI